MVFRNRGQRTFEILEPRQLLTTLVLAEQDAIPTEAAVHEVLDLDGDSDLDVILFDQERIRYHWLENLDGRGSWGTPSELAGLRDESWVLDFGDIDGDGDTDAVKLGGPHLTWLEFVDRDFRPRETITFPTDDAFEPVAQPSSADTWKLIDLDADSDLDLVGMLRYDDRFIGVALNDGSGSFSTRTVEAGETFGGITRMVAAVADLDGDGRQNYIVAISRLFDEFSGGHVEVFDSHSGVGRSAPSTESLQINGLETGDINGDGQIDLLTVWSDRVEWHLRDVDGSFTRHDLTGPLDGVFADIDGDGDLDWFTPEMEWLENVGDVEFVANLPVVDGLSPTGWKLGDVDGDGDSDFLVSTGEEFHWYRFDGIRREENAAITGEVWLDQNRDGSRQPGEPALAGMTVFLDLDDDAQLDASERSATTDQDGRFVFADLPPAVYHVRQLLSQNSFQTYPAGSEGIVATAHDVMLTSDGADIEFRVWQTDVPDLQFQVTEIDQIVGQVIAGRLIAADIDGDGDADLVHHTIPRGLHWLPNLGDGMGFGEPRTIDPDVRARDGRPLHAADLNGDGRVDLILASNTDIVWYQQLDGQPRFAEAEVLDHTSRRNAIDRAIDFHGDGDIDLILGDRLLRNIGGMQLFEEVPLDGYVAFFSRSQVVDLDNDGDLDILRPRQMFDLSDDTLDLQLVWHEQVESYRFSDSIPFGDFHKGVFGHRRELLVATADVDADGDIDAFGGVQDGPLLWYENLGQGSFRSTGILIGQTGPAKLLIASDMDLDGSVDLFTSSGTWFRNLPQVNAFGAGTSDGIPDDWTVLQTIDFDGDGDVDFLGIDASGKKAILVRNTTDRVRREADLDGDGSITPADIDLMSAGIRSGGLAIDLNRDGHTDGRDLDYLVIDVLGTHHGDVNLDGVFDAADLVSVFQHGKFEDGIEDGSSWSTGDWNGDGEFDSSDLVHVFKHGTSVFPSEADDRMAM